MFGNLEAITKQLWAASNSRNICSVKLEGETGHRLIYPHGIYMSKQKKLTIACWQKAGFTRKGLAEGFKNLLLENCETVLVLNKRFYKRRDFDPSDHRYGEWLFHI